MEMLKLTSQLRNDLRGIIPEPTLEYLSNDGVPEHIELQGLHIEFDLSFHPERNGALYRIADIDRGFMSVVLQSKTGFLGHTTPEEQDFFFSNSSIKQFIDCIRATEKLCELEKAQIVKWESRWEILERDIRQIDPIVLEFPYNPWVTLIGELQDGII
jgi:hypothetical protein